MTATKLKRLWQAVAERLPQAVEEGGNPRYPLFAEELGDRGAENLEYYERVKVPDDLRAGIRDSDMALRDASILIDTIHDGYLIPPGVEAEYARDRSFQAEFHRTFNDERDLGAFNVCFALAAFLGLDRFYRVTVARNLLDFGRFPGVSPPEEAHLDRLSIFGPLAPYLVQHGLVDGVLEIYDSISAEIESAIEATIEGDLERRAREEGAGLPFRREDLVGSLDHARHHFLRIAVHTFDPKAAGEYGKRPEVALVHRSRSIEEEGRVPRGAYSGFLPERLLAFTADRLLKAAVTTSLEAAWVPEFSDYPYKLPDGSVEMRMQIWLWYRYLRACFERHQTAAKLEKLKMKDKAIELVTPGKKESDWKTPYELFWMALSNPNQRHLYTRIIHGFLNHRTFPHELPAAQLDPEDLQELLGEVSDFYRDHKGEVARRYRYGGARPSTIVVEVRKDIAVDPEGSARVGAAIAAGVRDYYETWLPKKSAAAAEIVGAL